MHHPTQPQPAHIPLAIPRVNSPDLFILLKTREQQYKDAALRAHRKGDKSSASVQMQTLKRLQSWIRLVEAGGFLDLELYPVPLIPPVASPLTPPFTRVSLPKADAGGATGIETTKGTSSALPVPSDASCVATIELDSVEDMVSERVLEHEIQCTRDLLHSSRAVTITQASSDTLSSPHPVAATITGPSLTSLLESRLVMLEIRLKRLGYLVQNGQLTVEQYCEQVGKRAERDKVLAGALKQAGQMPGAKRALVRYKLAMREVEDIAVTANSSQ